MAPLPWPVMSRTLSSPAATASSTTYWMVGVSTTGSISLGTALVAGRKRVPRPAAGMTAFLIADDIGMPLPYSSRAVPAAAPAEACRMGGTALPHIGANYRDHGRGPWPAWLTAR